MNTSTQSGTKATILVSRSSEQAYTDAAEFILRCAEQAIAKKGAFTIALSGGSTPKRLYELLASSAWRDRIPWGKIQFFWGDERYVPPTDSSSNYRMTNEAMLAKVNVPAECIHRVPTELEPPEAAAEVYEDEVKRVVPPGAGGLPQFDLVLLGLGTNGHVASLFPFQPALHEKSKLVISEYIEEVKMTRISLTFPVINSATDILFLSLGPDKASVLKEVLTGKRDPERLPAQYVHAEHGKATWLLDPPAAAGLPEEMLVRR